VRKALGLKPGVQGDDRAGVVPHEVAPKLEIAEVHTRRLGQVLIEAGLISEEELAEALAEQAETGRLLGEILIPRRLVSSPILAQALAVQAGTELVVEQGFGAGLWARIEQRHPSRRITVLPGPGPDDLDEVEPGRAQTDESDRDENERRRYATEALIERIAQQELDAIDLGLGLQQLSERVTALEAPSSKTPVKQTPARKTAATPKPAPKSRSAAKPKSPATRRRPPAAG
jgi:hypothetical protein